jgi:heme/copper-type cytochrome/quinol oxidase subunit 1
VLVIRWQLAYPGQPVPMVGHLLGTANAPGGIVLPEFYSQLGAMHGTIMVFLGVVPLAVGAPTTSCRCRSARPTWRSTAEPGELLVIR